MTNRGKEEVLAVFRKLEAAERKDVLEYARYMSFEFEGVGKDEFKNKVKNSLALILTKGLADECKEIKSLGCQDWFSDISFIRYLVRLGLRCYEKRILPHERLLEADIG